VDLAEWLWRSCSFATQNSLRIVLASF
jgi:hypothetical protein